MKKTILITIITALLMVMTSPANAKSFPDTEGAACEAAVKLLSDLKILEGKSDEAFEPDSKLTRAEMAAIIIRLYGMEGVSGGSDIFEDVPPSHWAYASISAAYSLDIIKGVSETAFAPDDNVTYAQAVKMLICTLGYKVYAESRGGYPAGYLSMASQLGILKGVKQDGGAEITRGEMAMLAANAADTDILVRKDYGGTHTYVEKEGATLLSEYLDIYKYEGQITGNWHTTVSGGRTLKKGQILLGSSLVFEAGGTNAEELVGRRVTIYAKSGDGEVNSTVLSVAEASGTKVIKLDSEDILPKSTPARIYYEANGVEKYASIAVGADIVYNGRPADRLVTPAEGSITLISENSASFGTVIIEEYINLVVKSANADENMLYFKNAPEGYGELAIDTNDTAVRVSFTNSDGSPATVGSCREWNIISVARSADLKAMKVIRTANSVTGKITEYGDGAATINGTEYKVAKSLSGNPRLEQPKMGLEGAFYLDFRGRIAAVDEGAVSSCRYGYLASAAMSKGLDASPELKIFTSDGEMKVTGTADRITVVNGTGAPKVIPKGDLLNPEYGLTDAGGNIISQLIKYETNGEGRLTRIETAAVAADEGLTRDTRTKYFTLDEDISANTIFLGGKLRTFLSRYLVGSDCLIFNVPEAYSDRDDDYSMIAPDTIEHATYFLKLKFYDINDDNSITAIVTNQTISERVGNDALAAIVTDVADGINEDGEMITTIKVMNYKGQELTLHGDDTTKVLLGTEAAIVDPESETELNGDGTVKSHIGLNALDKGDIIQYEENNKKLTAVAVRLRARARKNKEIIMDGGKPKNPSKNHNYTSVIMMYSEVSGVSEKGMRLEVPSPSGTEMWERMEPFTGARVVLFDTEKETVRAISSDFVHEGDYVYVFRTTNNPRFIVVYR